MKEQAPPPEVPNSSGLEVWEGIRDVGMDRGGGKSASTLVEKLFINKHKNRLIFAGQPGVGKTILTRQFQESLERKGIPAETVFYDDLLERTRKQVKDDNDYDWSLKKRRILNANIYGALSFRDPKKIQITELVPLGKKDRCQTALKWLALNEIEREFTKILYVMADPELQNRSGRMRARITQGNVKDRDIEKILKDEFQIHIVNWPMDYKNTLRGWLIKNKLKKMALPEDIEKIKKEIFDEVRLELRESSSVSPLLVLMEQQGVPWEIKRLFFKELNQATRISSPPYNYDVGIVYNPTIHHQPITWYADMFELR
jgi:dephospho-CoA kinase